MGIAAARPVHLALWLLTLYFGPVIRACTRSGHAFARVYELRHQRPAIPCPTPAQFAGKLAPLNRRDKQIHQSGTGNDVRTVARGWSPWPVFYLAGSQLGYYFRNRNIHQISFSLYLSLSLFHPLCFVTEFDCRRELGRETNDGGKWRGRNNAQGVLAAAEDRETLGGWRFHDSASHFEREIYSGSSAPPPRAFPFIALFSSILCK